MKTKEKVLEMLEKSQGECLSGTDIAKTLGISRNVVWKAINSLKRDGYKISSYSNTGYMLSLDEDIFSASKIKALSESSIDIVLLDEATSSNNVAIEMAKEGAPEGTVVIVKRQTSGKGRMGRTFISNEENGLYMSLILRPTIPASQSINITVLGAVSALDAIEELAGVKCSIKWVNDIYIGDKKVCGILTEGALNVESGTLDYAVIGIGINVTAPKNGFDESIRDVATSVYDKEAPNGFKSALCAKLIDKLMFYYNNIEGKDYIIPYRERSSLIGKAVSVYRGNEVIDGIAYDIDDNANLILKTEEGYLTFNSGEARVRKNEK